MIDTKCNVCYERGKELKAVTIAGEEFMLCEYCYEKEAERGLL